MVSCGENYPSEGVKSWEYFCFFVVDGGFPAGVEGVGEDEVAVGGSVYFDFYQSGLVGDDFGGSEGS